MICFYEENKCLKGVFSSRLLNIVDKFRYVGVKFSNADTRKAEVTIKSHDREKNWHWIGKWKNLEYARSLCKI